MLFGKMITCIYTLVETHQTTLKIPSIQACDACHWLKGTNKSYANSHSRGCSQKNPISVCLWRKPFHFLVFLPTESIYGSCPTSFSLAMLSLPLRVKEGIKKFLALKQFSMLERTYHWLKEYDFLFPHSGVFILL